MKSKKVTQLLIVLGGILVIFLLQIYSDSLWGNDLDMDTKAEVVRVWTIHGDTEEALKAALEEYRQNHPEVTFEITVYKNEVYQTAINNAMITDNLPDIFFMWGHSKLQRFVDAGMVLDITEEAVKNQIPSSLIDGGLDAFTFEEKIYALPLYGWAASLFCNREIFERYQLEYPRNYEQFLEVCEELKKRGEVPIITGAKEGWLSSLYYMSLVQGEGPGNTIFQASREQERFKDSQFVQAAEKMNYFIKREMWQKNYLECDAYNAAYLFAQGKGAMLYYGSWATTLIEGETSSIKDKVDMIAFPNDKQTEGIGGYVDTFVINKEGIIPQNDELIQMYIDVMQSVSNTIVNDRGGGIPVYKNQEVNKEKYPLLYQCVQINKERTLYPAYDQIMSEELSDQYYLLINEWMAGEIEDSEFINELSKQEG